VVNRCRHDIVRDMLETIIELEYEGRSTLTRIARETGQPVDRAKRRLQRLEERGLVYYDAGEKTYHTTANAYAWLELYRQLNTLMGDPS